MISFFFFCRLFPYYFSFLVLFFTILPINLFISFLYNNSFYIHHFLHSPVLNYSIIVPFSFFFIIINPSFLSFCIFPSFIFLNLPDWNFVENINFRFNWFYLTAPPPPGQTRTLAYLNANAYTITHTLVSTLCL